MSSESSAPNKQQRKGCWNARDAYWKCLDENMDDKSKCTAQRQLFENNCITQWLQYFDRRREFLKFKEKMEKEGFDPVADTYDSTS
jgi:cytochrome c oxidase assembly factor 6